MARFNRPSPSPVTTAPSAVPETSAAAETEAPPAAAPAPAPPPAPPVNTAPPGPRPGFGHAPPGMITEQGGNVEVMEDKLPKGMISELSLRRPQVKPLQPIMEKEQPPKPEPKPRTELDDLNAPKAHLAETDLNPTRTNYAPTKKGPHPVEFPAKSVVNGKPVTLTEQASWTVEDGAIYRTDENELVSERKVQLLKE